jgi:flagellar biosynthesis/type III secretory pathway protein FliH
MPGISQALQDALNQAENDRDAATQADAAAVASAKQAATDQQGAQDAHQKATQSYQKALTAFFSEFGVTPPAQSQGQAQGT